MISQELYAAVVLAVLFSTIVAPFCLETSISYFNKQAEDTVLGGANEESPTELLEKGIRERTAVFFTIQTKSAPSWGLQTAIVEELQKLNLDVIDHRSWHPRNATATLLNEVYVKDDEAETGSIKINDPSQAITDRESAISNALSRAINQVEAVVKVQRWFPEIDDKAADDRSISEHILDATSKALHQSMREHEEAPTPRQQRFLPDSYAIMDEDAYSAARSRGVSRRMKQIKHLDAMFKGRLEGLFRRDNTLARVDTFATDNGVELLDTHGVGTGRREQREKYDLHGMEY